MKNRRERRSYNKKARPAFAGRVKIIDKIPAAAHR